MSKPHVSRIRIYPVKSLDPVDVQHTKTGRFSLRHDRFFAIVTTDGEYVNGKRTGRVNQLKAEYDLIEQTITLSERGGDQSQIFALDENNANLTRYLSEFFELDVQLVHRQSGELMDIPQVASVTVVSGASLESLHKEFPVHTLEDLRLRFRANIEIGGIDLAYWEEYLFSDPGVGIQFRMGDVEMIGISPRARCNVPPRDPLTGETDKQFIKAMMKSRKANLPEHSKLLEHGNFYHLTVNTYLPENQEGKTLKVGDEITIVGPIDLHKMHS